MSRGKIDNVIKGVAIAMFVVALSKHPSASRLDGFANGGEIF
jgi:hypothetical protein